MGYNLDWLAVRGRDRDALLRDLELRDTGRRLDYSHTDELVGFRTKQGWYVLLSNNVMHDLEFGGTKASRDGGEAVWCMVVDSTCYARAEHYKDGRVVWEALLDPEGDEDFEYEDEEGNEQFPTTRIEGTMPPDVVKLCDQMRSNEEDPRVEPSEIARFLTGYHHECDNDDHAPYEVLERDTMPSLER